MDSYYSKLRPFTQIESCRCSEVTGLKLVYLCSRNPIHCLTCGNEIDAERLGLSAKDVDAIAHCFATNSSLYKLWLESGAYEDFAKACLIDPLGEVNRDGMAIARRLSERWPTYYWWFQDADDDRLDRCPSCGCRFDGDATEGVMRCEQCRVIL